MRSIIDVSAALGLLLLVGCNLAPSVPNPNQQQDDDGPQGGESLAGTWTRQNSDPARVFDVTDDGGGNVHGELREPRGDFQTYSFDLKRKSGNALSGTAKFSLTDAPDKTFETKWEAKVEGNVVTVKQEELGLSEALEVEERTTVEHRYDVAPAAAAAPTPPPAMDMSAFVAVLPTYQHLLAEDIAVGQWVDVETDAMGNKSVTRTAVVHDAGDAWVLELDNQMNQKDLLLAVFVDKETGLPKKAYVGNRGKEGKEKEVPPPPQEQAGEAPQPAEEEVTVPAGSFPALRTDTDVQGSTYSVWIGAPGSEAEGVMLKSANPQGTDELQALEATTHDVSGTSFDARKLVYTSGNEMVMATGETKPHLNQVMLRTKAGPVGMAVTAQGDDAAPAFDYPR